MAALQSVNQFCGDAHKPDLRHCRLFGNKGDPPYQGPLLRHAIRWTIDRNQAFTAAESRIVDDGDTGRYTDLRKACAVHKGAFTDDMNIQVFFLKNKLGFNTKKGDIQVNFEDLKTRFCRENGVIQV